jgi:hypothetical protein
MSEAKKGKPGPKPNPDRVRSAVTNIRSSPEWKAWLEELAEANRSSLADLVDDAVLALAKRIKFEKPAPKR